MDKDQFGKKVESFKERVSMLHDVTDREKIRQTADVLQGMHFNPTLLFRTDRFLLFLKEDILKEINRVAGWEKEDFARHGIETEDPLSMKLNHISLLVYHYKMLLRLRRDEPEAWDEINELYEDD